MNTTMEAGEPPYSTSGKHQGTFPSGLGFFFVVLFLIITLCYGSYIYKRSKFARTPPITTTNNLAEDNPHSIRFDDILETFPTFAYSELVMPQKGDASTDANYSSGCSICLVDYNPTDILRVLPECGHVFHVSCIDMWWKVHPTCPFCRNSPLPMI